MAGPSFNKLAIVAFVSSAALALAGAPFPNEGLEQLSRREVQDLEVLWASEGDSSHSLDARGKGGKKQYVGIDFSKLNSHAQVRFLLSVSLTNSTPTAITIPDCTEWEKPMSNWGESQGCWTKSKLQTQVLSTDPLFARSCQSFEMINQDGGKRPGRRGGGHKVAITQANNTESEIGWSMDKNKLPVWVEEVKRKDDSGQINVDCETWWKSRSTINSASYYGKNCRLKLVNSDSLCIQASEDRAWEGKPIEASLCSHNPLQYFHLEAVAREFPNYAKSTNDPLYNTDAVAVVHNDPNRCEGCDKWKGFSYGGNDWHGDCPAPQAGEGSMSIMSGPSTTSPDAAVQTRV